MSQEKVAGDKPGSCPLCGGEQSSPWPRMGLTRCDECGLVFDKRIWLKGADLAAQREWFEEGYVGAPSSWGKIFERRNDQRTYRRLAPFLRNGASLLEVGVGSGSFLAHAKAKGADVTGCDLSRAICGDVGRRHQILMINCSVDDLPKDRKYDVVVMNHILEHVDAPIALLGAVASRLKEDGVLHVAVPNVACWEAWLSGWVGYEPYHFIYFSPDTLRKTVEKSGFTVLKEFTHEPFSAWFLAALRTVWRAPLSGAERRHAARHVRATSWIEHPYRICMVLAGIVSYPLRLLQASLSRGDELVALCRARGSAPLKQEDVEGCKIP